MLGKKTLQDRRLSKWFLTRKKSEKESKILNNHLRLKNNNV